MTEDFDQSTLLTLVKEKTKEANNAQRRLSKLEERYVCKHRENSELQTDRESLLSFIQSILEITLPREVGRVKSDDLESAWSRKQE